MFLESACPDTNDREASLSQGTDILLADCMASLHFCFSLHMQSVADAAATQKPHSCELILSV